MTGFTKLFGTIVHSTVWREDMPTKIVWITMLALADRNGCVLASIPGLSDAARVSLEECLAALDKLKSPDPWSRTKDHEGRRIEEIDGGWKILNYLKYRETRDLDERRLRVRVAVQKYREKKAKGVTVITSNHNAEADAEADAEAEKTTTSSGRRKTTAAQDALFGGVAGDQFEEFWVAYPGPRKQGKGAARKAWTAATLKPSWPGFDGVMAALEKGKRSKSWQDGYAPMPATWLNQERWTDEWEDAPSAPNSRSASAASKRVLR